MDCLEENTALRSTPEQNANRLGLGTVEATGNSGGKLGQLYKMNKPVMRTWIDFLF